MSDLPPSTTPKNEVGFLPSNRPALKGRRPVLIDEWQRFTPVWDAVKRAVDDGAGPGSRGSRWAPANLRNRTRNRSDYRAGRRRRRHPARAPRTMSARIQQTGCGSPRFRRPTQHLLNGIGTYRFRCRQEFPPFCGKERRAPCLATPIRAVRLAQALMPLPYGHWSIVGGRSCRPRRWPPGQRADRHLRRAAVQLTCPPSTAPLPERESGGVTLPP